jgi:hypothetical protein
MKEALSTSETPVLKEPHGVTSQKTAFFIVTAVKTSNLTETAFSTASFAVAYCLSYLLP